MHLGDSIGAITKSLAQNDPHRRPGTTWVSSHMADARWEDVEAGSSQMDHSSATSFGVSFTSQVA